MDKQPFMDIPADGLDVLMCYDYRELSPVSLEQLANYKKIHLVAWSMGVWVAGHLLDGLHGRFDHLIAIGGTLAPVHSEMGIPGESYGAIEADLSDTTLEAFQRSMFTEQDECDRFLKNRPQRDIEELHAELTAFRHKTQNMGPASDIFTTRLVTSRDRVFPLRNQLRAWGKENSTVIKLPHFPFYAYSGWRALLTSSTHSP